MASGDKGSIRCKFVQFVPTVAASVPNGAFYFDSANSNAPTSKGTGGSSVPIGATSSSDVLTKQMQNLSGVSIAAGRPVSKKANGSIVDGDTDGAGTATIIGITLEVIANNAMGNVQLIGPNVLNAVAGLGFAPGAAIYLGQAGGYIDDTAELTDNDDAIIRIGFADCAAGAASSTATDLILFSEVVSV